MCAYFDVCRDQFWLTFNTWQATKQGIFDLKHLNLFYTQSTTKQPALVKKVH